MIEFTVSRQARLAVLGASVLLMSIVGGSTVVSGSGETPTPGVSPTATTTPTPTPSSSPSGPTPTVTPAGAGICPEPQVITPGGPCPALTATLAPTSLPNTGGDPHGGDGATGLILITGIGALVALGAAAVRLGLAKPKR